jgi:RNase H-fold protein (predicted Holliday junction resolvase)
LFNIGSLLEQHKITRIVVGYPKQHELNQKLIDLLIAQMKAINNRLEIIKVDEEYSTLLAKATLERYDRQNIDDTVAAMHILDYYLKTIETTIAK